MTEPSNPTPTNRKGSESPPSSTDGDTQMAEGDSPPAVPPPPSGSTVTKEPVKADPNGKPRGEGGGEEKGEERNGGGERGGSSRETTAHPVCFVRLFVCFLCSESILALCERIGFPIDPTKVDADIADGSCTCQAMANSFANVRDRAAAGEVNEKGEVLHAPNSLGGWLGYDDANTEAVNAVVEALTPLMPLSHYDSVIQTRSRTATKALESIGFVRDQFLMASMNAVTWKAHYVHGEGHPEDLEQWLEDEGTMVVKWGQMGEVARESLIYTLFRDEAEDNDVEVPESIVRVLFVLYDAVHVKGVYPFGVICMEVLEPWKSAEEDDDEFSKTSLSVIARRFVGILEALAFCHERNIVHGDVNVDNVMFRPEEDTPRSDWSRAALIDFGMASTARPDLATHLGPMLVPCRGKRPYMTPECLLGTYDPPEPAPTDDVNWKMTTTRFVDDSRIDSWGAGTVLACWLSGDAFPFGKGTEEEVVAAQKEWSKDQTGRKRIISIRAGDPPEPLSRILDVLDSLLCLDIAKRVLLSDALSVFKKMSC